MNKMKVVILCGGTGTRLREETEFRPKPLVPIGEKPILVHIMELYEKCGYDEFILCLGYKGDMIKEYFLNHHWMINNFSLEIDSENKIIKHTHNDFKFKITFVDTGKNSQTGFRVKAIQKYIKEDNFMLTYGDGVSDVDINKLVEFHKTNNKIVTLTGVNPTSKYGMIKYTENNTITSFEEKPVLNDWINGGFFVCKKELFDYIDGDYMLEREPFDKLIKEQQMSIFKHEGFWHCMDTYKDYEDLNKIYYSGNVPWIVKKV